MPIYSVQGPNGKIYDINAPEDATEEQILAFAKRSYNEDLLRQRREAVPEPVAPEPEYGFVPSVKRGAKQLSGLVGDVLPAMVGKAIGADEYAKRQMEEYAQTEKEIQERFPARVPSYKNIENVGDAIDYVVESVGELVPSLLPSLFTGGVGGVAARGLTKGAQEVAAAAAKDAARKELMKDSVQAAIKSGAYGGQKETLAAIKQIATEAGTKAGADAALKYTARGQIAGAAVGSGIQNIPEVYQNTYEASGGEGSLGAALAFGGFNTALDTVLPAALLKKITGLGIPKEEVAKAWYKRLAGGGAKGFATEGATEATQEASSILAERFVNENREVFTPENFERVLNAGLKGGIGGGVATGVTDVATGRGPAKTAKTAAEDATAALEETLEEDKKVEAEDKDVLADKSIEDIRADIEKLKQSKVKKEEPKAEEKVAPPPPAAPVSTLTKGAEDLIAAVAVAPGVVKTDQELKKIATENGVEFNPTVDTAKDVADRLKAKKEGQDDTQLGREDSGVGAEVSGESAAAATEATTTSKSDGLAGDESVSGADKGGEGVQQLTLEEQEALQAELEAEQAAPVKEVKAKPPQAAPVTQEVAEETKPVSNRGKIWAKEAQDYRQQQAALATEIDADNTLSKEEKKSAKAFNNYMIVADGDPKRALDLLAADLYDESAFNKNPFAPNTGGFAAKAFYDSLSPANKQIVDERVAFLNKQEDRLKAQAAAREKREAARAEERSQYESDENALLQRTKIFGHTTKALIAHVFRGNTRAALEEIARGKGFSQLDSMIAKRILASKTFPNIEIVPAETLIDEKGRQASGQYVTQTDTAQIADGQVDSHSVLHEISHGYLHALIRDFQAGRIQNKGLSDLNDLYKFLKENHPELAEQYGMSDLSEFVSEMMSNPDFQLQLSSIPYQRVNAFTAFAQAVLRIMGISPNEKATALAAGLIAIDKTIPQGRLYQDNAITGKVVMPPPKVIRPGETADIEGLAGEQPKKAPREAQTYDQVLKGLESDVESKEGAPFVKKVFSTREGWQWLVRKFQNSREVLKRIQRSMEQNGLLVTIGNMRNDFALQFDTSAAMADKYYREVLQADYKDINTMAAEYAKASGQSFERAMAQLHLYAELKHEPERRHVLFLMNVPLKDDAAAIRKNILGAVSRLKGPSEVREKAAVELRAELEKLVADKTNLKNPLAKETDDAYNVIADRPASEVANLRKEQQANPQVSNHLALIEEIMKKIQAVNVKTARLNQIGHYWSTPVDNVVKFYAYDNYVPFKGRPDQETKNDIADPFSRRMSGDLAEGQDAMMGRVTEADNIILRVMAEGVKASLRAGRKDLTLAIKNAVNQKLLKGYVNNSKITGGKPISFEDRYVLGKSIKEIKGATNIFHYNDDGTIDVISLTDPEQREAIRRTFQEGHPFVDILNNITSTIGQMHTRYNPSFGPINFTGDLLTNAFTMGAEFGPKATFELIRTVAGIVGKGGLFKAGKAAHLYNQGRLSELREYTDPKSPKYDEFYADVLEYLDRGGKVSYIQGFATKSQIDLARAEMRRAGKFVTKADVDKYVDVWTDMFELASRAASYKVAKQKYIAENLAKGMSQADALADAQNRATYYAKNLANFEQVGEYGKTLGALYMFARPAATGAVRAIEALQPLMMRIAGMELNAAQQQQAKNAQVMLIGLAGMGYAAYLMSYMMADDDDQDRNKTATDDMDRWVRYMRFPLPEWLTGRDDVIFQMRWGFGLGAFASAGAQVAGIVHGNSTIKKGLENIVEVGLDSFLPLPVSRISITENPAAWFMDSATPSAFRPFMEYVMNVDSLGREIYNNRMTRAGDAYTGGDNIPEIYKSAARMLFDTTQGGMDVSPNTLYFFANNYLDGVFKLGSGAYNLGLVATGEKAFNPKTDSIIFDSFFGSPSNFDAREFSKAEKEIKEIERRLKTLEKDPENYVKFVSSNPEAVYVVDYYNSAVNGDLRYLREVANQIRADRNLSPKDRSDMLKNIISMQNLVKRSILNNFEVMGYEP